MEIIFNCSYTGDVTSVQWMKDDIIFKNESASPTGNTILSLGQDVQLSVSGRYTCLVQHTLGIFSSPFIILTPACKLTVFGV